MIYLTAWVLLRSGEINERAERGLMALALEYRWLAPARARARNMPCAIRLASAM